MPPRDPDSRPLDYATPPSHRPTVAPGALDPWCVLAAAMAIVVLAGSSLVLSSLNRDLSFRIARIITSFVAVGLFVGMAALSANRSRRAGRAVAGLLLVAALVAWVAAFVRVFV